MVKTDLKWTTVQSAEIEQAKFRLEASVFNIAAKKAKQDLKNCKWGLRTLCGDQGFATAFHRLRFKRVFVEKSMYPIFQPSQILDINPKPNQYISDKTKTSLNALRVKKNQILMTCSGTIGKVTLVSDTLENQIFSHDLIRITANDFEDTGYILAYLKTQTGQLVLLTNNYGAVVQHIEPEHLDNVLIPNAPYEIKKDIHEKVLRSFELRDKSNKILGEAERMLTQELKLPNFNVLRPELYDENSGVQTFSVKLNLLNNRFDGSYHLPIVEKIIDCLLESGANLVPLGNLSDKITMPGIFKRVYVNDIENGVPFLGTSEILELSPKIEKILSRKHHKELIEKELAVKAGMVLITDRGTIGNTVLVPKYFEDEQWTVSQNVLRVQAPNSVAGYLFIFLQSEYGKALIKRETYGAVIDMIDPSNAAQIPIPVLRDGQKVKEINELAFKANDLRTEAYYLEQAAIKQVNEDVIFAK